MACKKVLWRLMSPMLSVDIVKRCTTFVQNGSLNFAALSLYNFRGRTAKARTNKLKSKEVAIRDIGSCFSCMFCALPTFARCWAFRETVGLKNEDELGVNCIRGCV